MPLPDRLSKGALNAPPLLGDSVRKSGPRGIIMLSLTTPEKAQLNGFIHGTVLPSINSAEGL